MHIPSSYFVTEVYEIDDNIQLDITDAVTKDIFHVRLKSFKPEKVKSLISSSINSGGWYYMYAFNEVLENGLIGGPIFLSHINPNTTIDWNANIAEQLCIKDQAMLQQLYHYESE